MNRATQLFSTIQNETKQQNFIHLKENIFAEYNFVYHINDGYSVKHLLSFNDRQQLLFQKISNKVKQLNLMIVDSIFPLILADVVLETFLNSVSSFNEYCFSKKRIAINDTEFSREYLKYKFQYFIQHLVFSNIASEKICKGNIESDKIYYLKNQNEQIEYYSIFEQSKLQDLLFHKMKFKIDLAKSFISKNEASICFIIKLD